MRFTRAFDKILCISIASAHDVKCIAQIETPIDYVFISQKLEQINQCEAVNVRGVPKMVMDGGVSVDARAVIKSSKRSVT